MVAGNGTHRYKLHANSVFTFLLYLPAADGWGQSKRLDGFFSSHGISNLIVEYIYFFLINYPEYPGQFTNLCQWRTKLQLFLTL